MRTILTGMLLLSLVGCAFEPVYQPMPYPPPGLYPMGPMPTGQPVPGMLVPSVIQGQYYVTGQPYGMVHGQ